MKREEQIRLARQLLESGVLSEESANAIKADFPELSESEDERIRKALIDMVKRETGFTGFPSHGQVLAYLEKQKGQKPISFNEPYNPDDYEVVMEGNATGLKQKEQKPEHFELKAGKWYICHRAYCCRADHLTVKEGERFMCEKDGIVKGFVIKEPEKYFKECSAPAPMEDEQKEQKASVEEVLIKAGLKPYKDGNQWCILIGDNIQEGICGFGDTIDDALYHLLREAIAYQKEQRPAEWSDNDKRILDEAIGMIEANGCWVRSDDAVKQVSNFLKSIPGRFNLQPKQEWSKGDEGMINCIISTLCEESHGGRETNERMVSWLDKLRKSLRPQPKQEWSEEDENNIRWIVAFLQGKEGSGEVIELIRESLISWLKSLRPSWKPSEYTLSLVKKIADGEMLTCVEQMAMGTLYEQLKES